MWTISPWWLILQSLACLSDGGQDLATCAFWSMLRYLGQLMLGVEVSLVGLVDQTLVPLMVAQLLEGKQGIQKQPMAP